MRNSKIKKRCYTFNQKNIQFDQELLLLQEKCVYRSLKKKTQTRAQLKEKRQHYLRREKTSPAMFKANDVQFYKPKNEVAF